eukprot:TRINITY_DN107904_c0_g1_i1.p1 TRINITY_DN107904_c0_g1~~TRINITY_DN107904_c0_g1_i1.p1  ORF type:complete len:403 (+),score=21.66 TRINITY_DN107904_c0_g1_i1:42-1250(+)
MADGTTSPRKLSRGRLRGPERLYYDRTLYTGVHRHGGIQINDAEVAAKQFNDMMQARYMAWEARRPLTARRVRSCRPAVSPTEAVNPLPFPGGAALQVEGQGCPGASLCAIRNRSCSPAGDSPGAQRAVVSEIPMFCRCRLDQSRAPCIMSPTAVAASDGIPRYEGVGRHNKSRSATPSPPRAAAPDSYGPQRFFYDRNSYTGTHRFGGPCSVDDHIRLEDLRARYSGQNWLVDDLAGELTGRHLLEDARFRSDSYSPPSSPSQVSFRPTQPRSERGTPDMGVSLPRRVSPRASWSRAAAGRGKIHRSPMVDMQSSANTKTNSVAGDELFTFWRETIAKRCSDRVQSPSSRPDRKMDDLQRALDSLECSTPRMDRYGPEHFFYDKSTYTGTHRYGGPSIVDT